MKKSNISIFMYFFVTVLVIGMLFGFFLIRKSTYSAELIKCGTTGNTITDQILQENCFVLAANGWQCESFPLDVAGTTLNIYTQCKCLSGVDNQNRCNDGKKCYMIDSGKFDERFGAGFSNFPRVDSVCCQDASKCDENGNVINESTSSCTGGCYCNSNSCEYVQPGSSWLTNGACQSKVNGLEQKGFSKINNATTKTQCDEANNKRSGDNSNKNVTVNCGCYCSPKNNACGTVSGTGSDIAKANSDCVSQVAKLEENGFTRKGTSNECYTDDGKPITSPTTGPTSTSSPTTGPTSTSTVKPASSVGASVNPQTGTAGIIIVWIIGLASIIYSFWYFKKSSLIK